MTSKHRRKIAGRFPVEETWIREFVAVHGTDAVTRFCEDDLQGVPLVLVLETLAQGIVVSSEKCDGPGAVCDVEHQRDDGAVVAVTVYFASNEEILTIRNANILREPNDETNNAA